jgi:hypothetical protein
MGVCRQRQARVGPPPGMISGMVASDDRRRPGCHPGRPAAIVARFVLIIPVLCMGSFVARHLQNVLAHNGGTPYEGALAGGVLGLLLGIGLCRRAISRHSRAPLLADLTLVLLSLLWLVAVLLGNWSEIPRGDVAMAFGAALAGATLVLLLLP